MEKAALGRQRSAVSTQPKSTFSRDIHPIEQLATFPISGRRGRVAGTRELMISKTPFIAAYAIEEDTIVILAIYRGAQHWPETF